MSIDQDIEKLEALSALDQANKELSEAIGKARGDIDSVQAELSGIEERLAADTERIADMDKTRADLGVELRQNSLLIDRSRERLQRARNEREVNAAEREVDELRKIQRDRNDEIRKMQELTELAREGMADAEKRREELRTSVSGPADGGGETIAALEEQLSKGQAEREAIMKTLPKMLGRRYERVLSRGKIPIARVHDGTCLGCYVKLLPMLFHQMLARQKFEQCPQCYRLIYYVPKPPPGEDDVKADEGGAVEAQPSTEAST